MAVFALAGFVIGSLKIPDMGRSNLVKRVGGESIDKILIRYFKFQRNKKIYTYTKEEE